MSRRDTTHPRSLATGPVTLLGAAALLYGITSLVFGGHSFALSIPHGRAPGERWLGLSVNGWSELLFVAIGVVLLLASRAHWAAKSACALIGAVTIVAAVVALIRGNGVFGIFAANGLTELVWAAGGVVLLLLARAPAVGGRRADGARGVTPPPAPDATTSSEPLTEPRGRA